MREMKDSGVEWIEEIPKDWEISSFKRVFSFDKGLPITKENLVETGIPVLSYGQIHSKSNSGIRLSDDLLRYVSEEYLNTNPSSLARRGDILFADTSEDYEGIGNCAYISTDTPIFAGYHTIITRPKDIANPQYLAFLFQTDNWRSQLRGSASGIKVFTISQSMLKEATVIIPSSQTQHRIADYLNAKCAQIDRAIARQQEVIEKLKEYKLSVITEAVTKGLNSDVPMKDSGIKWIGEIPAHWEAIKMKFVGRFINGYAFPSSDFISFGIRVMKIANIQPMYVSWLDESFVAESEFDRLASYRVEQGDLVFALTRPIINGGIKVAIFEEDERVLLNQRNAMYKGDKQLTSKWQYYLMQNTLFVQEFALFIDGTGQQPNISTNEIANISIPLPPILEQNSIAEYLDRKFAKIDGIISQKQSVIHKLTEYKKSLIYEVVTGKKEV